MNDYTFFRKNIGEKDVWCVYFRDDNGNRLIKLYKEDNKTPEEISSETGLVLDVVKNWIKNSGGCLSVSPHSSFLSF